MTDGENVEPRTTTIVINVVLPYAEERTTTEEGIQAMVETGKPAMTAIAMITISIATVAKTTNGISKPAVELKTLTVEIRDKALMIDGGEIRDPHVQSETDEPSTILEVGPQTQVIPHHHLRHPLRQTDLPGDITGADQLLLQVVGAEHSPLHYKM